MIVDKLCARCGKLMVQVENNRKRCPECALIVHREQARQRHRERKEEMLQRGVQRVKKATIAEINRLAAELGMSYGEYVAAGMPNKSSIPTDGSDRDARE